MGASRNIEAHGLPVRCERDVLECPRCSGRMRLISTITQPEVIRSILECIGLLPRAPPIRASRGLEQADFDFGAS
jgi:hypothetical protein